MSANINTYLALVTSEHRNRPNFIAMLSAFLQAQVDQQNQMAAFPNLFDVDLAVGDQLDKIGQWVGVSRYLNQEVAGVTVLNDTTYRILVKLFIAMNTWDGTVPGIYNIWNTILAATAGGILVQDNQDMSMLIVLLNPPTNVIVLAILTQGYFLMRPAGVLIEGFYEPSLPYPATPIFGFDVQSMVIAGFDTGAWVIAIPAIVPETILLDKFQPVYADIVARKRAWPYTTAVQPWKYPVEPIFEYPYYAASIARAANIAALIGPTILKPFFP